MKVYSSISVSSNPTGKRILAFHGIAGQGKPVGNFVITVDLN